MMPEVEKLKELEKQLINDVREYQKALNTYVHLMEKVDVEEGASLSEYAALETMMHKGIEISRSLLNNMTYILKPVDS